MKQELILKKKESYYNPYFLGEKKVNRINFYENEKVIFIFNWIGSNNRIPVIDFEQQIVKKNNIDLLNKSAFYVNSKNKKEIDIYIPLSLINNYTEKENVFYYETETYTQYKTFVSFTAKCIKEYYELDKNDIEKLVIKETDLISQNIQDDFFSYKTYKPLHNVIKEIKEILTDTRESELIEFLEKYNVSKR